MNYTNFTYNPILDVNCSTKLAEYGEMIDGRIRAVIIGLALVSVIFYILINKKLKDYNKGVTKTENYKEILKSLQMYATLLVIGTIYLLISATQPEL